MDKGTIVQINTVGKFAIGAGIAVGALAVLAACGKSEQDPQSKALDAFQPFDRNRDNQWTQDEATKFAISRPYTGPRVNTYRLGDMQFYQQDIRHTETTSTMGKAFAAARGNDAVVSLQELVQLASSFDVNGDGTLNRSERRDFDSQYGPTSRSRTVIDSVETGWYYIRDDYPRGGTGGGTSPGDDYGSGGGTGGGTSPGDDYGSGGGYTPPSGGSGSGTAPGDDGGSYVPPSSGGSGSGSSGSVGSGNSTDNGNPSEDDF